MRGDPLQLIVGVLLQTFSSDVGAVNQNAGQTQGFETVLHFPTANC